MLIKKKCLPPPTRIRTSKDRVNILTRTREMTNATATSRASIIVYASAPLNNIMQTNIRGRHLSPGACSDMSLSGAHNFTNATHTRITRLINTEAFFDDVSLWEWERCVDVIPFLSLMQPWRNSHTAQGRVIPMACIHAEWQLRVRYHLRVSSVFYLCTQAASHLSPLIHAWWLIVKNPSLRW